MADQTTVRYCTALYDTVLYGMYSMVLCWNGLVQYSSYIQYLMQILLENWLMQQQPMISNTDFGLQMYNSSRLYVEKMHNFKYKTARKTGVLNIYCTNYPHM